MPVLCATVKPQNGDSPRAALAGAITRHRHRAGLTVEALARILQCPVQLVQNAERPAEIMPALRLVSSADTALLADGELVRLWEAATGRPAGPGVTRRTAIAAPAAMSLLPEVPRSPFDLERRLDEMMAASDFTPARDLLTVASGLAATAAGMVDKDRAAITAHTVAGTARLYAAFAAREAGLSGDVAARHSILAVSHAREAGDPAISAAVRCEAAIHALHYGSAGDAQDMVSRGLRQTPTGVMAVRLHLTRAALQGAMSNGPGVLRSIASATQAYERLSGHLFAPEVGEWTTGIHPVEVHHWTAVAYALGGFMESAEAAADQALKLAWPMRLKNFSAKLCAVMALGHARAGDIARSGEYVTWALDDLPGEDHDATTEYRLLEWVTTAQRHPGAARVDHLVQRARVALSAA